MKDALIKTNAYNNLIRKVDELRLAKFSFDNNENSKLIFDLWTALKGEQDPLDTKITKRWTEIGFQGSDPSTDFRGMGLLGLINLK